MSSTPQGEIETDALYELLSSSQRRRIVAHLRTRSETTLDDLVETIADAEDGPSDERPIAITLVHNHLPRLDDADVVDYDRDAGSVVRGDRFADLRASAASIDLEPNASPLSLLE